MEKRLECLEERLLILERYIEIRFCESFRDFSNRNKCQKSSVATTLPSNQDWNRQDLLVEVVQPLEVNLQVTGISRQPEGQSFLPPPPKSPLSEPSVSRSSRRIAARKQNGPGPASKTKPSSTSTILPSPFISLVRAEKTSSCPETSLHHSPPPPVVKIPVDSDPEQEDYDNDSYFSYTAVPEDIDDDPIDGDGSTDLTAAESDTDWTSNRTRSRASTTKHTSIPKPPQELPKVELSSAKLQSILDSSVLDEKLRVRKQCQVCKKFWKQEGFEAHVLTHSKERTLKCRFCEKTFFNRNMLTKHEKTHQLDKYGIACRVGGCSRKFTGSDKILAHERTCIRRALENGLEVDPEVMEDVKRRSRNVKDLRWPDKPVEKREKGQGRYCAHCKIWIGKGFKEHQQKLHAKWKCPLCPEEAGKRYVVRQKLVIHLQKYHNKEAAEGFEDEGGEEELPQTQQMDVEES